jgi:hypothetical protein
VIGFGAEVGEGATVEDSVLGERAVVPGDLALQGERVASNTTHRPA